MTRTWKWLVWAAAALSVIMALSGCAEQEKVVKLMDFTATATASDPTQTPTEMAIPVRPSATPDPLTPMIHATRYPTETPVAGIDIQIGEKMFIAQCNDIYLNASDYIGKIISIEGLYKFQQYPFQGRTVTEQYVMRYGPGCCGNDGSAGFELAYDGEPIEDNAWVRVVGTLDMIPREGTDYFRLVLRVMQLQVLDVRGAEFVLQ